MVVQESSRNITAIEYLEKKKTNKQTLDLNYTLDQVTQTYIGHSTQHQKHAHSSQM